MVDITTKDSARVDHATSLSICRAIGEKLQQSVPQTAELPSRLEELMAKLRRQEQEAGV